MAKNKTSNNDLFKGFNPPKLNTVPEKKEIKKEVFIVPPTEDKNNPVESKEEPEKIKPVEEKQVIPVDDMAFAMPPLGRPKVLEGKYHLFSARLREDLFEYAQSLVGKDKEYQSVNDYINRLIAKDMLSK